MDGLHAWVHHIRRKDGREGWREEGGRKGLILYILRGFKEEGAQVLEAAGHSTYFTGTKVLCVASIEGEGAFKLKVIWFWGTDGGWDSVDVYEPGCGTSDFDTKC